MQRKNLLQIEQDQVAVNARVVHLMRYFPRPRWISMLSQSVHVASHRSGLMILCDPLDFKPEISCRAMCTLTFSLISRFVWIADVMAASKQDPGEVSTRLVRSNQRR